MSRRPNGDKPQRFPHIPELEAAEKEEEGATMRLKRGVKKDQVPRLYYGLKVAKKREKTRRCEDILSLVP